ncbi:MAG: hypothetical protein U1F43_31010 [Myxococcota bacterium]
MDPTRLVTLLVLSAPLAACGFGVGAGLRYHHIAVNDPDGVSANEVGGHWSKGMFNHELTVYDRTGLLLAGLATAGNRYNAAQDALARAQAAGVPAGTEVPYTYQVHTPVPNTFTRLTFSWGSTDVITDGRDHDLHVDMDYLSMELRTRVLTWPLGKSRHLLALDIGAHWTAFEAKDDYTQGIFGLEFWNLGIPIGLTHAFAIDEHFIWSSRLMLDPVMSLISALVGGGIPWEVGTRVDCAITKNFFAFADVQYRYLAASGTGTDGSEWTGTIGLGFVTGLPSDD